MKEATDIQTYRQDLGNFSKAYAVLQEKENSILKSQNRSRPLPFRVPNTYITEVPDPVLEALWSGEYYLKESVHKIIEDFIRQQVVPKMAPGARYTVRNGRYMHRKDYPSCIATADSVVEAFINCSEGAASVEVAAPGITEVIVQALIPTGRGVICLTRGGPLRPKFRLFWSTEKKAVIAAYNPWVDIYDLPLNPTDRFVLADGVNQNWLQAEFDLQIDFVQRELSTYLQDLVLPKAGTWIVDIASAEDGQLWFEDIKPVD